MKGFSYVLEILLFAGIIPYVTGNKFEFEAGHEYFFSYTSSSGLHGLDSQHVFCKVSLAASTYICK